MTQDFLNIRRTVLLTFVLFASTQLSAQTIALKAPVAADNPNYPGDSPWPKACASDSFKEYFVTIEWAGTTNDDNEFILELSDPAGAFNNPTELSRVSNQNNNNEFLTSFDVTPDIQGSGYRMRVRSTSPASTSAVSDPYPMYYLDYTSNLHISPNGDGSTPGTIDVCDGQDITLTVDNVPSDQLNTYQYAWYRSGTLVGNNPSIIADQTGEYWVYIDYGECTFNVNTESNHIIISTGSSTGIAINAPATTALCAGEVAPALEASVQNAAHNYTWFKDGVEVQASQAGAFSYTVDTNDPAFPGDYSVRIAGSGICSETSAAVTITNTGAFSVSRDNNANLVLLPGQSKTLAAITDANSPSYEWFRNGVAISSSNSATFDISQAGNYHVAVTQTGGTCASTTVNSETTEVITPTGFRLEIAYATSYEECANSSIVIETRNIYAILADNSELDVTADVATSFAYQWKKDGADLSSESGQSISLTSSNENGTYAVEGSLDAMTITSNELPVQLSGDETLIIESTSSVYCSATDTITLSTAYDLSGQTFAWERDGAVINSTDSSIETNQPGAYRLVVQKGTCPLTSNELTIAPLDPNLITLDVDGDVIFPEGSSKTVTASGGTAYRWLDTNNVEISGSSSVTFTEEGSYLLIANIDNCEVSKPITVTYLDLFNIPNVITPNGDGANDQWVIPNSYSNKSDVSVIIYDAKGIEVMNTTNYSNNWPESSVAFTKQNMVFYYVIKNATETLKQGTITVIR